MPVKIFFCYAHEDEGLLNKLKRHIWPLRRQGLIDVWHDRDISAGTEWEQEISQHLNTAQIILLLVSPDFLYSEYCYGVEMKQAIERHQRGEAQVIPIIIRPVYWQGILGLLQALPKDGLPITDPEWHTLDRALYNVTEGIRTVIELISVKSTTQAVEEQLVQFSAPSVETPAHPLTAEPKLPVVEAPKQAHSQPSKVPEAVSVPSAVHVPKQVLAKSLLSLKLETLSLLRTLTGHTGSVNGVVFSPDGQTLASSSFDTTIKIWE